MTPITAQPITDEQTRQLIEFITTTAKDTREFVVEQAPLVAQEILHWVFWSSLVNAVVATTGVVLCLVIARRTWRLVMKEEERSIHDQRMIVCVGGTIGLLVAGIGAIALAGVAMDSAIRVVKVSTAPRVVLINSIKELSK